LSNLAVKNPAGAVTKLVIVDPVEVEFEVAAVVPLVVVVTKGAAVPVLTMRELPVLDVPFAELLEAERFVSLGIKKPLSKTPEISPSLIAAAVTPEKTSP